jgi:hypothetical protein
VTATLPGAPTAPTQVEASAVEPAGLAETHLSWLVFLGDYAVKVKKPLRTDFCDFTTLDRRRAACQREVALNRRLAADVYLGVLDILGPAGRPCEHAVLMRRLPSRLRLSRLIRDGGDVHTEVRRIAEVVAAFHARAVRSPEIDRAGSVQVVRGLWEENLGVLHSYAGLGARPGHAGQDPPARCSTCAEERICSPGGSRTGMSSTGTATCSPRTSSASPIGRGF